MNNSSPDCRSLLELACGLARTFLDGNETFLEDIVTIPNGAGVGPTPRGSPEDQSEDQPANESNSESQESLSLDLPTSK